MGTPRQFSMLSIFQVSTLLLVCLTSIILAGAEEFPLAAATIPIAIVTWWFVDRQRIRLMPGWLAPILALISFWLAIYEYQTFTQQSILAVCGHLLTYLIWIFLFQEKSGRQYWVLLALCLLQVAVSAMLTYSIWFGAGLLAYALLAIWTLSVFLLYSSTASLKRNVEGEADSFRDPPSTTSQIGRVWNNVALGPQTHLLTGRFIGNTVFIFVQTLLVGSLFFLLIPRIWANSTLMAGLGRASRPLTGFTNEVRLGDLGEILEDPNEVMTLQVLHSSGNTPLTGTELLKFLGADPLFRGAVLEDYRDGHWTHDASKATQRLSGPIDRAKYRIHFDLKPLGTETVFTFGNVIAVRTDHRQTWLHLGIYSQEVRRSMNSDTSQNLQYDQYTDNAPPDTWFSEMRQTMLRQSRSAPQIPLSERFTELDNRQYLNRLLIVPDRCAELRPITARVVQGVRKPEDVAQRIEDWFTSSGEFNYTTKLSIQDSSIDPIMDFMLNRRTGHCEYFASAMAIMLRTQGIPGRVITGFKGGTLISNKKIFRIQQLHAHAWVEAYLNDRWVTFDPTPPERNQVVDAIESRRSLWWGTWLGAETAWVKLAGMTQETQQARIYGPLVRIGKQIATSVNRLRQGNFELFHRIKAIAMSPARWFSWEGGILAAVSLLLLSFFVWGIRKLWRAVTAWNELSEDEQDALARKRRIVPFYERFLHLLKSQGLEQRPTQTAREFVDAAWIQLQPRLALAGAAGGADELVETFYRVRFGGAELESIDLTQMENLLNQLESSLQQDARKPGDEHSAPV